MRAGLPNVEGHDDIPKAVNQTDGACFDVTSSSQTGWAGLASAKYYDSRGVDFEDMQPIPGARSLPAWLVGVGVPWHVMEAGEGRQGYCLCGAATGCCQWAVALPAATRVKRSCGPLCAREGQCTRLRLCRP